MESAGIRRTVMIEAMFPKAGVGREVLLVCGGSLLLALAAQFQIVLPFSLVPVTGQTLAVLLLGALYGSRRGPATVLTYLTLGFLGLPLFAGGACGLARFVGPTGGYLVGFLAAAGVVGFLSERGWDRSLKTAAGAMFLGNLVIYAAGACWLSRFVAWDAVLAAGVFPFLVGDALKIGLATVLLPASWRLVGRLR